MLQDLRSKSYLLLLFAIFLSQQAFGQLTDFTLTASATNETCTANGSLSYAVSNTSPGAIIIYRIFKLPDTVTPIAVTSATTYGGLTAGTYRIVAIQSLGSLSNTQQQDVQISNLIVPVVFQIAGQPAPYCGTTASLTANVTQGNPVSYEIISGPMTFPTQPSNTFSGLVAGDYVIRVNDACGDGVVQTYHFDPPPPNLIVGYHQSCDLIDCNTKIMYVDVTAIPGTAIGYPLQIELTLAPQGFPILVLNQTITSGATNTISVPFTIPYHNIPVYQGNIRVVDACGNVKVAPGITLDMLASINIDTQGLLECTEELKIGLCNLLPPFTVNFLSAPAGFNPTDFNPTHPGPFTESFFSYTSNGQHELPEGHYDIQVTDACGTIVHATAELVKAFTDHKLVMKYVNCVPQYMVIIPDRGVSPLTVILSSAPAAYTGPVPADMSAAISNGIFSMILPVPGTYVFTGVNICGDPYIRTVTTIPPDPLLVAVGSTVVCGNLLGAVTIQLQGAPPMATVIMTSAPAAYPNPIPDDVSEYILSAETCQIPGLPIGNYTFLVTDDCGTTYPAVTATISPGTLQAIPIVEFLRGCESGEGSMKMRGPTSKLVQVIITAAPAGFSQPLPYDVSFNILPSAGIFYMNSLPQGTYTFHTKDACGVENDLVVEMLGSQVTTSQIDVIANCGSFNLALNYVEAQPFVQEFWMQKYNPVTGQWEHPLTGVDYVTGTVPTAINSYRIFNQTTNYNIASLGHFRILKRVIVFSNGGLPSVYSECYLTVEEFDFTGELSIVSSGAVPCSNNSYNVFIDAAGVAPYIYRITEKNGQPFFVDNGNSNIFTGLSSGIYNFQVEDSCGNIVNSLLDITILELPSVFAANLCEGQNAQLSVQAISFLSYQWWNASAPGTILSTTNVLAFTPFSNATTPGTYYVRIYSTSNLSCIDMTIPYVVSPSQIPKAGTDGTTTLCGNGATIDLFTLLGAPYDTGGTWTETSTSGTLNGSNWASAGLAYGDYSFVYSVNSGACGLTDDANVIVHLNPIPPNPVITAQDNICSNGAIELQVDTIAGATYHWTGPDNFSSNLQNPTIAESAAANSGTYTVTANVNGCESSASVALNIIALPDFKINAGCVAGTFTLSVAANESPAVPYDLYEWSGPNGFNATGNPVTLTAGVPGVYTVTVTNSEGCTIEKPINITSTACSISNVITPNGDSFNQYFDLSGLDVERLEIYSRWGRLVYEANNYIDEWYGQNMHGKELPDSTYYYIIYLRSGGEKQGWVYKMAWQ